MSIWRQMTAAKPKPLVQLSNNDAGISILLWSQPSYTRTLPEDHTATSILSPITPKCDKWRYRFAKLQFHRSHVTQTNDRNDRVEVRLPVRSARPAARAQRRQDRFKTSQRQIPATARLLCLRRLFTLPAQVAVSGIPSAAAAVSKEHQMLVWDHLGRYSPTVRNRRL